MMVGTELVRDQKGHDLLDFFQLANSKIEILSPKTSKIKLVFSHITYMFLSFSDWVPTYGIWWSYNFTDWVNWNPQIIYYITHIWDWWSLPKKNSFFINKTKANLLTKKHSLIKKCVWYDRLVILLIWDPN